MIVGTGIDIAEVPRIAESIARLLENPPQRARLARAAKSIVVQFDWKQLGRKQRALYREILRSPRTT